MTDVDEVAVPGWGQLLDAGAVDSPAVGVVERATQAIRHAAQSEHPEAGWRGHQVARTIGALASVAAMVIAIAVVTTDRSAVLDTVTVALDGTPALSYDDPVDCHLGEARVGELADTVSQLGYLAKPIYRLESLLVREERDNCPAYSPTLTLELLDERGQVQRSALVYGPMVAAPWESNDPDAVIRTEAPITESTLHGQRLQLVDLGQGVWRAAWLDDQGRGWSTTAKGLNQAQLVTVLNGLQLTPNGATAPRSTVLDMAATSYPASTPTVKWNPYWNSEYRTSDGTTFTVDVFLGGPAAPGNDLPAGALRHVPVRHTTGLLATLSNPIGEPTHSLTWHEDTDTWITISSATSSLDELLTFAEALQLVSGDDPRLQHAK